MKTGRPRPTAQAPRGVPGLLLPRADAADEIVSSIGLPRVSVKIIHLVRIGIQIVKLTVLGVAKRQFPSIGRDQRDRCGV